MSGRDAPGHHLYAAVDAPAANSCCQPSPRALPSCTRTPAENFKTMRLLSYTHVVDVEGRWWKVETRQCPYTGIILRQTRRITGSQAAAAGRALVEAKDLFYSGILPVVLETFVLASY